MKAKVLLVDDDQAVARSLGRALTMIGGFEVRTELEGTQALQVAREFKPDLILLDVLARHWDGGEVAGELEREPDLQGVPIAFLTGLISEEEAAERATDSQGRRLIPKSLEPDALVAAVHELLEHSGR